MSKKKELDIFLEAVKGAKPLSHDKVQLKKQITTITSDISKKHSQPFKIHDLDTERPVGSETDIHYKHNSISQKILRNLQKGQYNIDAILDLHGMTIEKARKTLEFFLQECIEQQDRVVLIIHGKSRHREMPVLKNKINNWLRNLDCVLAFCKASAHHGGQGAVYVLLKNMNEEYSGG